MYCICMNKVHIQYSNVYCYSTVKCYTILSTYEYVCITYLYISWLTHHPKKEPDGDSTLHTNMQRSPKDILYQVHGKILARHEIVAGGHMHQHIE